MDPTIKITSREIQGVQRILISDDFVYFGGEGSRLPAQFLDGGEANLLRSIRNYQRIRQEATVDEFEEWIRSLGVCGYQGKPWDWVTRRK